MIDDVNHLQLLEEQRGGREKRKIREFMQKWTAKARNH